MSTELETKTVRELSTIRKDADFLQEWTDQNQSKFCNAMNLIYEQAPLEWVKIYKEIVKMQITPPANKSRKEKIADNVTINNTQINKLDSAAEITDTSWRNNGKNNFSGYEEIK